MGDPQTGEQEYQSTPLTVLKLLNSTPGFPAWGSDEGAGTPRESGMKASGIYLHDFHRTEGNRDSNLGGHKKNLAGPNTQRKAAVTQQVTEPKLPASVGWSPVEAWVGWGSPQGPGPW